MTDHYAEQRERTNEFVGTDNVGLAIAYKKSSDALFKRAIINELRAREVTFAYSYDEINFLPAKGSVEDETSVLLIQHGGDHYKKLGVYQPWQVAQAWGTEDEFRGYMKFTAMAYLARGRDKGGDLDIDKAIHTLQAFREMTKNAKT